MKTGLLIINFAIVLALIVYCCFRGYQVIRPQQLGIAYVAVFVLMFASLFVGLIWGGSMPAIIGKPLSLFGYTFVVVFVYFAIGFILTDIFRLSNALFHFMSPETMFAVRKWTFVATLGVTTVLLIVGNYKFKHPEIVKLNIEVAKPHQGKSLNLLMASDLHLSTVIDRKRAADYVAMINAQKPDIVVFSGDLIDRDLKPLFAQKMYEELKQIQAPLGVYAVFGNHEYISGNIKEAENFYRKSSITLLRDSACLVDSSFYLVGQDDLSNKRRKPLSEIVAALDADKPRILLNHQPNRLADACENDIDLQLSGHTHYGQFFPINLIVKRIYELPYGYKKIGKTHFYVSSGLGIWGPQYRIGTQSEILVMQIKM